MRGFTFVSFLVLVGGLALVGWVVTYGPAYWDNIDVNRTLKEAANMCYREHNDETVRRFVFRELHKKFDTDERDTNGDQIMVIDVQPEDLRIERVDSPPMVNIWLTYQRTVTIPLLNQQRAVTFYDHADQDLSPVKW